MKYRYTKRGMVEGVKEMSSFFGVFFNVKCTHAGRRTCLKTRRGREEEVVVERQEEKESGEEEEESVSTRGESEMERETSGGQNTGGMQGNEGQGKGGCLHLSPFIKGAKDVFHPSIHS